ncbi:MAG: hypothetical protein JO035_07880 [Betaproteobacteria bacterium]|nr:hypothetical protein [Betaproteobacteria bacterium]
MSFALHFGRPRASVEPMMVGPMDAFCLEGSQIRSSAGGDVIAENDHGLWHVEQQTFSEVWCESEMRISFVEGTHCRLVAGTFRRFGCVNGVASFDGAVFAVLDNATHMWKRVQGGDEKGVLCCQSV